MTVQNILLYYGLGVFAVRQVLICDCYAGMKTGGEGLAAVATTSGTDCRKKGNSDWILSGM